MKRQPRRSDGAPDRDAYECPRRNQQQDDRPDWRVRSSNGDTSKTIPKACHGTPAFIERHRIPPSGTASQSRGGSARVKLLVAFLSELYQFIAARHKL